MKSEILRPIDDQRRRPALARRHCLCWIAAAIAAGCGHPVMASSSPPAGDARLRFAKAVGVDAASLRDFQRLALPAGSPAAEVWIGIGEVAGDPQPWLVPVSRAGEPGPVLRLPIASRVDLLARVDLAGSPLKIDLLAQPGAIAAAGSGAATGKLPALLLRASHRLDSGEQRETLVLVALQPKAAVVWREISSSLRPGQQGFRSFALEFVAEPGQPWLAIDLFQTTLPAAGQQPAMPGPPLRLQFGHRDGSYRRIG